MEQTISRDYTGFASTGSTNTALKERVYSSSLPVYDVFFSDAQTGGRGRLGRSFYSPPGGAYFSAAYPLEGTPKNIPFFTLLAGAALMRSIKELTGVETLIKWPNDIYFNGRKLAGILTELVSANGRQTVVFGAGVNISVTDFPTELGNKMTSFAAEGLPCPRRETLIRRTVEALDDLVYKKDLLNRTADDIISGLNKSSFLLGKTVVHNGKIGVCGTINPDGSINIAADNKSEKVFFSEIIEVKH